MSLKYFVDLFRAFDRRVTSGIDTHAQLVIHGDTGQRSARRRA